MDLVTALARRLARHQASIEVREWPREADLFRPIQPAPSLLPSTTRTIKFDRGSKEKAIRDGFERCVWLFAGVRIIARALASVPLLVEVNRGDGWEPPEPGDKGALALRNLVRRPNKRMTGRQMLERISILGNLSGEAILHKVMLPSVRFPDAVLPRVSEIRVLTPVGWEAKPDPGQEVSVYKYHYGGFRKDFPAEEIIHFKAYNPGNPYTGLGAGQVASRAIASDDEAAVWQLAAFANRAVGDGVFVSPKPLSPEEYDFVLETVHDQHMGSAHAREPWVLGGGWEWKEMSRTPVEMDYINTREHILLEIAASISLNPAFLRPDAKYSNLEQARKSLWQDNVVPSLDDLADTFALELVPHFGDPERLRITYDVSDVEALREDLKQKAETFAALLRAGVPYDHAVALLDLGLPLLGGEIGETPHGTALALMVARERGGNPDLESRLAARARGGARQRALLAVSGGNREGARYRRRAPRQRRFRASDEERAAAKEVSAPLFRLSETIARGVARRYRTATEEAVDWVSDPEAKRLERIREQLSDGDAQIFPALLGVHRWADRWLEARRDEEDQDSPTLRDEMKRWTVEAGEIGAEVLGEEVGRDIALDAPRLELYAERLLEERRDLVVGSTERGVQDAVVFLRAQDEGGLLAVARDEGQGAVDALIGLLLVAAGVNAPAAGVVLGFLRDQVAAGKGIELAIRKATRLARGHRRGREDVIGRDVGVEAAWGGQRETWAHAVDSRQIRGGRKIWVDSDDAGVCPTCLDLDGQVVRVEENYFSEVLGREVKKPGDPHPGSCRCGEAIFEAFL